MSKQKTFALRWVEEVAMETIVKAKNEKEARRLFFKGGAVFDNAKDIGHDNFIEDSLEVYEQ